MSLGFTTKRCVLGSTLANTHANSADSSNNEARMNRLYLATNDRLVSVISCQPNTCKRYLVPKSSHERIITKGGHACTVCDFVSK